uniref:Uncharacterized protein n=1 Tax=Anopheles atroparvus TaxID=41427 RepID=A0A182IRM8_ANOAO
MARSERTAGRAFGEARDRSPVSVPIAARSRSSGPSQRSPVLAPDEIEMDESSLDTDLCSSSAPDGGEIGSMTRDSSDGGKDGQVIDPYRALEWIAQASLGNRHAGPNGGRLLGRVTSADTCHGEGKFLRYQNTRLHRPVDVSTAATLRLESGSSLINRLSITILDQRFGFGLLALLGTLLFAGEVCDQDYRASSLRRDCVRRNPSTPREAIAFYSPEDGSGNRSFDRSSAKSPFNTCRLPGLVQRSPASLLLTAISGRIMTAVSRSNGSPKKHTKTCPPSFGRRSI